MKFSKFRFNLQSSISTIYNQVLQHWQDILFVSVLAAIAGFASYQGEQLINKAIFDKQAGDVWLGADIARVFENMTQRKSDHHRIKVHPLFSLITFPAVHLLRTVLDLEPITAVRIIIAAVACLWISALFILLRVIGCRRFDATLFSVLAATSAAAMFWFVVPETYSFGSLSLLLGLCFVAIAQHRHLSHLWYTVISALTLSITTTNWMVGILATIVNHPRKRSLQITVNAFCLVVLLWSVQKFVFPSAVFFLGDREEQQYMLRPGTGGPLAVVKSFISHTMVMPSIKFVDILKQPNSPMMSIQASLPGSASLWGNVAVMLWISLLGLGLWGLFSVKNHLKLRIVLGLTLLGQLTIHMIYGEETFLYSLHFAPLLVVLAALSTLTSARPVALVLAGTLVLSAGVNNTLQLSKAIDFLQSHVPPRYQVLDQMQMRPDEPWPRGKGHVILAAPGSREVDKAYHEPGGSFSPAVGSFGVSLWLTDIKGNLKKTSDNIPLNEIDQQLSWTDGQNIPGILTKTSSYQALWSSMGPKRWTLNLKAQANANTKPMLVIRSVGPAGGQIQALDWDGKRLLINNRWSMIVNPAPGIVHLGEEGTQGWMTERSNLTQWKDKEGWGYARFELGDRSDWNVVIQDTSKTPVSKPTINTSTQVAFKLDLPDKQFTASLNAQVAHLMMSLVDQQTRPGDPMNYPLSWQRDGAYIVVALGRAGHLEVAKDLSTYFAKNDFFGGFGPEADAPGLSIWALNQVAMQLNQPEYDEWVWPHICRKAEFILKMLATDRVIHQPVTAPVVPKVKDDPELTLVADPARDGLIIGRMDGHRPLLFVNAVSYRGLLDAASLADRINQPAAAKRWRAEAVQLQKAWRKAFKPPESNNPRTYISSLWPTWVATSDRDALFQRLQARWTELRDAQGEFRKPPLWTYFDVAEAHQWLFLDRPDRVWKTLRWFWKHQASPGLYTWWEGEGEENTSHRWEYIRGWVNPPYVTPHYWTAAEILLLQLDMLAYIDQAASDPTLVIGAGIPAIWLEQPMKVQGLPILNGQVDWIWDNKQLRIKFRNMRSNKVDVRLGAAFPSNTPLYIEYLDPQ